VVDNRGALISSFQLLGYTSDFGGPLELVVREPGIDPVGMLSLVAPERPEAVAPANQALYVLTINGFEPGSSVRVDRPTEIRWQWADGNGWSIDKRLTVDPDGYLSNLSVSVENPTQTPIFVTVGPGLEMQADNTRAGLYLTKGAVLFDGAAVEHITDDALATAEVPPLDLAWGGIESNYFLALLVPETRTAVFLSAAAAPPEPEGAETGTTEQAVETGVAGTRAQFGVLLPSRGVVDLPLYVGPKDYDLLAAAGHDLERAVDYGRFRVLARPVDITLKWLYEQTGNYGLAIILATLGVRLIFFPLSQRSMKSMRKMQQLQPQMNAIKAKYKGSKDVQKRQEMNAEVMQLYKDNGVSPLGGCLPMLLQMPVLFGFYAAISVSIVSRQAPFVLWLQDLSKMDPYYVLPLLMGASMYLQQRMSPGTGDPVQQRIFRLMPVMFTFFFLRFPSGLVIYWLVNTVLGIAQQAYVNHQLGAPGAKATTSPATTKSSKGQAGGGAKRKKRGKKKR
jgi:YidC/Oxa1 family membrane protein insertase